MREQTGLQPKDTYTLGTGVRCYFNTTGIYIGGGLDWERIRLKDGELITIGG